MGVLKFEHLRLILVWSVLLFLAGITQILVGGWDWGEAISPAYLFDMFNMTISGIVALLEALYTRHRKLKQESKDYVIKFNATADFAVKQKEGDYTDFHDEKLRDRKITAYKVKMNKKISKLEDKGKKNKAERYKKKTTDEYINENIKYIKVDYEHVSQSFITNGYNSAIDKELESGSAILLMDLTPKFILGIVVAFTFRGFSLSLGEWDAVAWYRFGFNILFILTNYIYGWAYAEKFFNRFTMSRLNFRLNWIKEYLGWRTNKKRVNTDAI